MNAEFNAIEAAKNFEAELPQGAAQQFVISSEMLSQQFDALVSRILLLESELHKVKSGKNATTTAESDLSDNSYLRALADSCKLDLSREPEPPNFFINFCGNGVMSEGGLTTIVGAKKSRKTTAAAAMCAAYLAQKEIISFEGAQEKRGRVLWFDTEQSSYHLSKALQMVLSLSDLQRSTDRIVTYAIRGKTPEERFAIIDFILSQDSQPYDLVIIDGAVDLAADPVLKREEATKIVNMLLQQAENKKIHIVSVLHENGSNDRGRGHIFAELANKSETVFSVKKADDKKPLSDSTLEVIICRNYADGKISFNLQNGIPTETETAAAMVMPYNLYAFADAIKAIFAKEQSEWIKAGLLQTRFTDYKRANVASADKLPRNKTEILEAIARLKDAGVIGDNGKNTTGRAYKWIQDLPVFASNNLNA